MKIVGLKSWLIACALPILVACAPAGGQPNMESALNSLQNAKVSLERAAHNKGGYRVRALEHVNEAIREVEEGIRIGAQ